MADGGVIQSEGFVSLEIDIEGIKFNHEFLIADVEAPLVIGWDFQKAFDLTISMGTGAIHYRDRQFKCILESQLKSVFRVSLTKTVVIPPATEIVTKGLIEDGTPDYNVGLTELDENVFIEGLLVAKVLVDANQPTIPLRLINLSDHPIRLVRKRHIATCSPVALEKPNDTPAFKVNKISKEQLSSMPIPEHLENIYAESIENLDSDQQLQVKQLLTEYQHIFSKSKSDLGCTKLIQHRINTGLAPPIKQNPRPLPQAVRDEVSKEIDRMLDAGLIEKSCGPWSSPIVPCHKADGSIRLAVDYRRLNDVTLKDSYPLPKIQESLDCLKGAKYFSTLDCSSGFHQVPMHPDDMDKTSFTSHRGQFRFNVLSFGLTNAPALYQRLMEYIMSGLQYEILLIYVDDCMVFSKTFDEHIQSLREVLKRFADANLKLTPKKCHLFRLKVNFLGHVVEEKGISPNPEKVSAIKDWPTPTSVKDIRAFLGVTGYYRRLIKSFATIASPLTKLTQKDVKFDWTPACQEAFVTLREALTTAPILAYPNSLDPYLLDCDASSYAIGSVLSQMQNGQERVIAYYSRTLSKPERQYCVTRRELLAVVESVTHFHQYLYGVNFKVRTDHSALSWALKLKVPLGQMSRWINTLNMYSYKIIHRPGAKHSNADGLSRRPCDPCSYCEKREKESESTEDDVCTHKCRVATRRQTKQKIQTENVSDAKKCESE